MEGNVKNFLLNGQEACGHQRAHEAEDSEHGADAGPDHKLGRQLFIVAHLGGHHRAGYRHRCAKQSNHCRILIGRCL